MTSIEMPLFCTSARRSEMGGDCGVLGLLVINKRDMGFPQS